MESISKEDMKEFSGYWWLESKPSDKRGGTFRFSQNKGRMLILWGEVDYGDETSVAQINGITSDNKYITLYRCTNTRNQHQSGGYTMVEFYCDIALVGNFFPVRDQKYTSCSFIFSQLDSWRFGQSVELKPQRSKKKYQFEVLRGKLEEIVSDGLNLKLQLHTDVNFQMDGTSLKLTAPYSLKIQPKKRQDFDWFLNEVHSVRDFAALCFASPLEFKSIHLYAEVVELAPNVKIRNYVEVLSKEVRPTVGIAPRGNGYPLVHFRFLALQKLDFLSSWNAEKERYAEVIDLLMTVIYNRSMHVEVRFLIMMQAFEAFDRISNPRTLVSEDDFQRIYLAMLSSIPNIAGNDIKQKLDSSIKYANEPSLRKRLKDFFQMLEGKVGAKPFGLDKSNIGLIVDTRNYYTHYAEELREKKLDQRAMYIYSQKFCVVLLLCILDKIGISMEATKNGLHVHSEFRSFVN